MPAIDPRERVTRERQFDQMINASPIEVTTSGGSVVTLSGTAPLSPLKLEAESAAKRM